ncbi:MAG TPA: toluene-4-monooxygenase system B family protein [Chloroflexia bacterium]|nr:toluene-4-monooxygenase system B family protein [Chloroflexia bacterium]
MALYPLAAVFHNDFVVLLVPVDDADNMDVVAEKVAHHTINRRLQEKNLPMRVKYEGKVLPGTQTIMEAGIPPMGFVEVFYDE